jgi:glycosyltransferase involved in cell wall biosynthesis
VHIFLNGNVRQLSSFSIINRHLISALRRRGHRVSVFPSDDTAPMRKSPPPDVYIFHGHPWDARSAPGQFNVFALNYELLAPDRALRALVARLNAVFDLVVVPAAFAKPVLTAAGLKLPIELVPWGCDHTEFHPRARPAALPTSKSFVFLYVGAVNERKGIDVLLRAYGAAFSAGDDVALVIKESMRHATWEKWADARRRDVDPGRAGPARGHPEVLWLENATHSVAGYFAAADVGVFPHRGEGFGLPILECIASGRRVIVTAGTGPEVFCNARNAWQIRAGQVRRRGQVRPEPDARQLRSLLRSAYVRGKPSLQHAVAVSETVRDWTWQRSAAALGAAIRRHTRRRNGAGARRSPTSARHGACGAHNAPAIAYAFHSRGQTSWKKLCAEVDRTLAQRYAGYRAFTYHDRLALARVDIAVGQSEHCLELLLAARRINPSAIAIVHQECTVLGDRLAIVNRERQRCGLAAIAATPMELWRQRMENQLADRFIVASTVARQAFLNNGFAPSKIHVIPHGIRVGAFHFRAQATKTRFLFVGTDPFRKGVRHLLAAWDRAALPRAELICCVHPDVLQSKPLLRYLVRNPSVVVRPLSSHREFLRLYGEIDCQVLPSLEDTFSMAVADGMGVGKPAIVSTATGVKDLITHDVNGHVVPSGNIDRLAESLYHFAADRRRLKAMGEAAYETARQFTWARFRRTVSDLIATIWETAPQREFDGGRRAVAAGGGGG